MTYLPGAILDAPPDTEGGILHRKGRFFQKIGKHLGHLLQNTWPGSVVFYGIPGHWTFMRTPIHNRPDGRKQEIVPVPAAIAHRGHPLSLAPPGIEGVVPEIPLRLENGIQERHRLAD